MVEEWRNIDGYEGLYQVSNYGRVKSLNYNHTGKECILKTVKDKYGYLFVYLYKDGKGKNYRIHRLVAQAFLDNPDSLPCINHRDECKTNNNVDNLEYCTHKENNNWGTRNERAAKANTNGKRSKPVVGVNPKNGEVVAEYPSTKEAERNGFSSGNISKCCLGKRKTAYGYIWRYK